MTGTVLLSLWILLKYWQRITFGVHCREKHGPLAAPAQSKVSDYRTDKGGTAVVVHGGREGGWCHVCPVDYRWEHSWSFHGTIQAACSPRSTVCRAVYDKETRLAPWQYAAKYFCLPLTFFSSLIFLWKKEINKKNIKMKAPSQRLPSQRLLSRRQRGFVGLNASRPPAPMWKDVASPFVCRQSTLAHLFLCSYEKGQGQSFFFFAWKKRGKGWSGSVFIHAKR